MSGFLSSYVTRLFLGGFLCFCVTAAAGKGGAAQALRLCCACFMTILILSPLFGGETGQFSLSRYAGEAEDIISSEVAQAQKDTLKEINDGAESYLNGVLSAYGEGIYAKIVYSEDENGSYSPQNVHIYGYTGDEGSLRQSLADMTGLPPDCVIFER